MKVVSVGLVTPDASCAAQLRSRIRSTGFGTVAVEVDVYPRSRLDPAARKFVDVQPDLILIATDDPSVAVESVRALRAAVPSWMAVAPSITDEAGRMKLIRSGASQLLPPPVTEEHLAQTFRQVQLFDDMLEARERVRKAESTR